jgi:alpha-glucosidase
VRVRGDTMKSSQFISLGDVVFVEKTSQGVLLGVGEEKFRADVICADVLRLKISQSGHFDESPTFAASFRMPEPPPPFTVTEDEASITLATDRMSLVITRRPFMLAAYRSDGTVIFEDHHDQSGSLGYRRLNDTFVVMRRIAPHDAMYGLGQKTGAFDRRGRKWILWNTDVLSPDAIRSQRLDDADHKNNGSRTSFDPYYTSIPFFYHCRVTPNGGGQNGKNGNGTNGHVKSDSNGNGGANGTSDGVARMAGFFVDNAYKANIDFAHKKAYSYVFHGGQYTEYVFAGPGMPEILAAYTFVTGRMGIPPLWALGHHQCRFHDYTAEQILEIGHTYRERRIPCDVLWLDIGHMDGYRVFTWDDVKFPDVDGMVRSMGAEKLRLGTIVDPGVKAEPGYAVYEDGRRRDAFCKTESGNVYTGQVWPGRTVFPDFSRADVRAWWSDLNAQHVESGIAGIWNDMNEPATGPIEPFGMRFDRDGANHPHERFHNQYALLMALATYEGLRKRAPDLRPFVLSRAGFAGIQRYAAQWLGDNASDWENLRVSIPMAMGMGVSGQPFIGADIPGFSAKPTPELAVRWMQYGAMTPFCRCHNEAGELDQYPWSFGPGVERRSRAALELRYRLLPYIYSAFVVSSETGAPVQRPLVYEFQDDRQVRETDDAYLFGDALLVAPVVEPGQTARHVYLPQGTWVDWETGEVHDGGQFITSAAPLDRIPIFARGGRIIPTYAAAPVSTMDHHPELLELHVIVPQEDGGFRSQLQEDDGVSDAYRRGGYLRTTFTMSRQGNRVRIAASVSGAGFPEFRRKQFRLVFRGAVVETVEIDGVATPTHGGRLDLENDGESFALSFRV